MIGITKEAQLKRMAPLKEKPFKSKAYLDWFHNQGYGCMVCGTSPIHAHHVKKHSSDPRDDRYIIPLCELHHIYSDEMSPHGAPKAFRNLYHIELQKEIASKLYNVFLSSKMV